NYFITQAITGHGCFRTYTKRIGKTNDKCLYCEAVDTAEHTLFACPKWIRKRMVANLELGVDINSRNMIAAMTKTEKHWILLDKYVREIMSEKEIEERKNQQRQAE
ncbi:MAG: hypothetical protein KTM48_02570, partial [Wolbachia endosymbiont of Pissodes strobi]|nr:hypothetical protein [Wolbachia endosymbiont of Pissodes strobi]